MDIYQEVSDRIIEAIEHGEIPWLKPWVGTLDGAISHATGKPYSIINQLLLGKPGEWLTFEQCKKEGGHVKKGAKSRIVVFWKIMTTDKTDANGHPVLNASGEHVTVQFPVLKYFRVFHISDCEGITPRMKEPESFNNNPIEAAERVLHDYIEREHIGLYIERSNRAFYRPSTDEIHLPLLEQFEQVAEFYSTAFHEATHSTGHEKRLNRLASTDDAASGLESYSKEELVAEIGACAIMNRLGIETASTFRNSAAYVQGWLKALRNDKRMIVSAAGKAEKAVQLIMNEGSESNA